MSRLVFGFGLGISSLCCALACATGSNGGGGGGAAGQTSFGGAAGSTSGGGSPAGGSAGASVGGTSGDGGATGGSAGASGGAGGATGGSGGATGGTGGATGGTGGATGGTGGTGGSGGTGGGGPKGPCCAENVTKGCSQPAVESCVCAIDPYCCDTLWDDVCAGEVLTESCGTCPTPTDCCAASSASGCSSIAVSNCVCDAAPSCCVSGWSASCVNQVTSLGCGVCAPIPTGSVWINEIHYDDDLADAAEGVEIAGPAGTNLSGYTLVFYNGNPSQLKSYMTQALTGSIPDQQNGVGTLWFAKAGIQNGGADTTPEPDGIALVNGSSVVQFLSYEGAFTPTDAAASGQLSLNIGVSEISTTPDGLSLQLTGTGKQYGSFTWAAPATATPGAKNGGQTFN